MRIEVDFPGGVAVAARFDGHTVLTDQPPEGGGTGGAPAPFDLFLASIATCMAYYALAFCRARKIATEGMTLELDTDRNRETHRNEKIRVSLRLPGSFPSRYVKAVLRAMDRCAVKRHLLDPPDFEVKAEVGNGRGTHTPGGRLESGA